MKKYDQYLDDYDIRILNDENLKYCKKKFFFKEFWKNLLVGLLIKVFLVDERLVFPLRSERFCIFGVC